MQVLKEKLTNVKILKEDREQKVIILSAEDEKGQVAILSFARKAFPTQAVEKFINSEIVVEKKLDHTNDIWNTYQVYLADEELNNTKLTLIYPATQKLIDKYTTQKMVLVEETGQMYEEITKPHLNNNQHSLTWVYNILEGKSEQERVLFHDKDPDTGFLLAPSMAWMGDVDDLYLNTLTNRRDLTSIRDLRAQHLPLLQYMRDKTMEICLEKYALEKNQLRIFFHYQPSFYHLHLHVVNINYRPAGSEVGRAVLLRDVIDNLKLDDVYYKKATLTYLLKMNDPLYEKQASFLDTNTKSDLNN